MGGYIASSILAISGRYVLWSGPLARAPVWLCTPVLANIVAYIKHSLGYLLGKYKYKKAKITFSVLSYEIYEQYLYFVLLVKRIRLKIF